MSYLFTSESVSEGHPDKVADQVSDALIDNFLAFDPESKVACETLVTTGQVVLAGEVKSKAYLDLASQLCTRADLDGLGFFCGGISISDKETRENDDDRVIPKFEKELHDDLDISPEAFKREE